MIQILEKAHHRNRKAFVESSQTLEFVSLLLSKYTPNQSQQSLGFLKQLVPLGSLGASPVQTPQNSSRESNNDSLIALGWKVKSLQSSADCLLVSAKRLETEAGKEAKYWKDALNLKQEGWALCRKPNELHTLAIRYGFEEARSSHTNRGFAALRREEEGNVSLDFGGNGTERRLLQVRIVRDGRTEGVSGNPTQQKLQADGFSSEMMLARRSLFDAELYSELHREARTLTGLGVKALDETIQIPMTPSTIIQVSLATPDGLGPEAGLFGDESTKLQAEAITTSLRILLDHAHEQNLQRRSGPPGLVTEKPPPKPSYPLIRPVLEYFSHAIAISSLKNFVAGLSDMFSAAKLNASISVSDSWSLPPLQDIEAGSSDDAVASSLGQVSSSALPTSLHQMLVLSFLRPRHSHFQLSFPSPSSKPPTLCIDIFTRIDPPQHHGTSFRAALSHIPASSALVDVPSERTFPDLEALKQHVLHLSRVAVTELISSEMPRSWGISQPHLGRMEAKRFRASLGGGFEILFADLDHSASMTLKWRIGQGETGEEQSKTWYGTRVNDREEQEGLVDVVKDKLTTK